MESNQAAVKQLLHQLITTNIADIIDSAPSPKFCEFLRDWLQHHAYHIQTNTYNEYKKVLEKHIYPYFREKDLTLREVRSDDIENYYADKLQSGMSPNTVLKHHANLFSAFKYAESLDLICSNPMTRVHRPKCIPYVANFYSVKQLLVLFELAKGNKLYLPILLAGMLGLRRSEVVGLQWNSINFSSGTITIRSKAIHVDRQEDRIMPKLKTKSSYRTLGLPQVLLDYLREIKSLQTQRSQSATYNKAFRAFVCVDEEGNRLRLSYITETFTKFIRKHNLDIIRYHDLRHSCATMLMHLGYPIKQIQQWLGHSDIQTTMRYIHMFCNDNQIIAASINNALNIEL